MADSSGGPRPGAGRPRGSKNSTPTRSLQAQQRFAELIAPQLEAYFKVLDGIAKNKLLQPKDRMTAINMLLDRSLGRPKEIVEISAGEAEPTPDELLEAWNEGNQ